MATFVGELQLVTTFSGQELQVGLSDLNWARIGSYVKFKNPQDPQPLPLVNHWCGRPPGFASDQPG